MRSLFLILTWSALTLAAEALPELAQLKARIERASVPSGVLYDLSVPLAGIERLDGSGASESAVFARWLQAAFEMKNASLAPTAIPSPQEFQMRQSDVARDGVIPLVWLDYQYERLRAGVTREQALTEQVDGTLHVNAGVLEAARVFTAAPLYGVVYHGAAARFVIDFAENYFTNLSERPKSVEIDFGDGAGLQTVSGSQLITVHYQSTGTKFLRVRLTERDGSTREARSELEVRSLDAPPVNATWNITASQSYNGVTASGEAYVYLADGHSDVVRPLVVSDGFDIGNTTYWDQLYDLLNQQNLIETARALGYDIVMLNYTDATTYIQANAYVVEALLDTLEQVIPAGYTYAFIGPSMGGLTSKYALAHLESLGNPANVRTYFSFDSPHRGAVIPLGLQYWVNYFSSLSADAALFRDALNSPAARQMLVQHFTDPPSNVAAPDPLRGTFLNDLAAIGTFPQLPRKVALANGSGHQVGMTFAPGAQLIRYEYTPFSFNIRGNVWAVNNAGNQTIFDGRAVVLFIPIRSAQTVTIQATTPWDNAPGGTSNSMQQLDQVPAPYGDIIALHNDHCFIPTISALDLNTNDPFFNIAGESNLYGMTPFDSVYFLAYNQEHVEVNPDNFWWIIEELVDSLPAPQVVVRADSANIFLNWTRVPATRSYQVYTGSQYGTWNPGYVSVTDTLWQEAIAAGPSRFYKVVASSNP